MSTITIATEKELKSFVNANRKSIICINGVEFTEMYPMLNITGRHASYYDVESQRDRFLFSPFVIKTI